MWLLKDRMSLAMPEALAHANLWEAKVRNLAWSEVLPVRAGERGNRERWNVQIPLTETRRSEWSKI